MAKKKTRDNLKKKNPFSTVAYCKDPGSPQNGVRHGNEFTHSKRISFTCLPGYKLTGSASAVCINGKWSAAVPRCKGTITCVTDAVSSDFALLFNHTI